jgi:hypothetical protein
MDKTSTLMFGYYLLTALVVSMPSLPGILRSIKTTSGSDAASPFSNSSPFSAS